MGGGQTQFYELARHGISFVADPLQMTFTNNERKTVQGVLNGDFEIGFVRTDQIERTLDVDGELIDPGASFLLSTRCSYWHVSILFLTPCSSNLFA